MNLLLTGAWQGAKQHIEEIEAKGHKVLFMQYEKDSLPCDYSWVQGVVCNGLFLTHPIEKFTNLRYIQLTSAGYDRVPLEYIQDHRIKIFNACGVYSIPMAEYAVSGVLQIYKHTAKFAENQNKMLWQKDRDIAELFGKTVCIFGCGNVGTCCAKLFKAFGCRVYGGDVCVREDDNYSKILPMTSADDLISQSDIVLLTLPLTEQTRHFINSERLEKFKPGALLVNISRGAVVDTHALENALNNRKIGGAVLDVFEEEPLSESSPLWSMDNVIITPHNSFVGENNNDRLNSVVMCNVGEYLDK